MTNLAVSIAGGNHRGDRVDNDFYPTPRACLTSLFHYEKDFIPNTVWEPCCGDGAISSFFVDKGFDVLSTDLVYRGYGEGDRDFLNEGRNDYQAIITNPPFNLAAAMIEHALGELEVPYMALLLKSQYWHSKKRIALFDKFTPSVVYPMTWRPDFLGKGSPTMDCQWTVWRKGDHDTRYRQMKKIEE